MFTGLVETRGSLVRRTPRGRDARLAIRGDFGIERGTPAREPLRLGESIAIDGVCLTVDVVLEPGGPGASLFEVDASAETLEKTTLGYLNQGSTVNLERAMPLGGRMGGHIVTGHVDGVGRVVDVEPIGASRKVVFEAPAELARYIAPKGSITVGGVSLTVNGVDGLRFDVVLIPHTQEKTSFDTIAVGAQVNLEVDILARYVARLLDAPLSAVAGAAVAGEPPPKGDAVWLERLRRAGYV